MASNEGHLHVPISSITKNVIVHVDVTGIRTWRIRLWCGIQLMRLAAWVAGVGIRFNREAD